MAGRGNRHDGSFNVLPTPQSSQRVAFSREVRSELAGSGDPCGQMLEIAYVPATVDK